MMCLDDYKYMLEKIRDRFQQERHIPICPEIVFHRCKFLGKMMLLNINNELISRPTFEEWVGINLLDRDGEL